MISIDLLGPFELALRERPVAVTRRRERWLLAVLALEANRVVPVGRLVDLLWVCEPPATAHRMVHSHVSRLRSVFSRLAAKGGAIAVVSHDGGYALHVETDSVDVHRFRHRLAQAAALPGRDRAAVLRSALDLWRGEYADAALLEPLGSSQSQSCTRAPLGYVPALSSALRHIHGQRR